MDDVFSAVCSGAESLVPYVAVVVCEGRRACRISVGKFLHGEAAICCNGRVNRWVVGLFATIAASCGLVL